MYSSPVARLMHIQHFTFFFIKQNLWVKKHFRGFRKIFKIALKKDQPWYDGCEILVSTMFENSISTVSIYLV